METAEIAEREKRRQKRLRRTVGGMLVAAIGVVMGSYWLSNHYSTPSGSPAPHVPKGVEQQVSGFTFTRSEEGRRIFTIHAARSLEMKKSGTVTLQNVVVEFYGQQGDRDDILRTNQGDYDPLSGDLSSSGSVELEVNVPSGGAARGFAGAAASSDQSRELPMVIDTSNVRFARRRSLVMTRAPVEFRIGQLTGSARGLEYSTARNTLDLISDVKAELTRRAGDAGQVAYRLTARDLHYDKGAAKAVLGGPVEVRQGTRAVTAGGQASIDLNGRGQVADIVLTENVEGRESTPSGNLSLATAEARFTFDPMTHRLRGLEASGGVEGHSDRSGRQSELRARQLALWFAGRQVRPTVGDIIGNVRLTSEPKQGPSVRSLGPANAKEFPYAKETLTADAVHLVFRGDGRSLSQAVTAGLSRLAIVPSEKDSGSRQVTAGKFLLAFDSNSRIETLRGVGGTSIEFDAPPGTANANPPAITTAQETLAHFDAPAQAVKSIEQWGDFRFQQGDWRGKADRADYSAADQLMVLTGRPEISDTETRALADRVVINLQNDTAQGIGHVEATHLDTGGPSALPTNALADRMTINRRNNTARYQGHVRAWRGTDVIESSELEVDRAARRVSSNSPVIMSLNEPSGALMGSAVKTPASGESDPVTVRADRFFYRDDKRQAVYEGNVEMDTQGTRMQARGMTVFLSPAVSSQEAEVERAIAVGHVIVTQPGRRATGEHAEYSAHDGKIVMTGGPPRIQEANQGYVTGHRLTFFLRNDRLLVDGGSGVPAVSAHRVTQ